MKTRSMSLYVTTWRGDGEWLAEVESKNPEGGASFSLPDDRAGECLPGMENPEVFVATECLKALMVAMQRNALEKASN